MSLFFCRRNGTPRPYPGLNEHLVADTNPAKVNLRAVWYFDDNGSCPCCRCRRAEKAMMD